MDDIKTYFVENILNSPLNIGLVVVLGYISFKTFLEPAPKQIPVSKPKVVVFRNFTPVELSAFDGKNGSDIYLAVAGKVFDVSSKPDFYGPGKLWV